MKTYLISASLAILLVASSAAAERGAAVLQISAGTSTSSSANASGAGTETEGGASAGVRMDASARMEDGTDTDTGNDSAVSAREQVEEKSAAQRNDKEQDDLNGNAVSVAAIEVRGWDATQKKDFLATVKAQSQVKSGQDLENFAKGVLLKDENVDGVEYTDQEITVDYKGKGKLFGFVPIAFTHRVTVDTSAPASERVKVHFPWYSFLMKTGLSRMEIESEVAASLSADLTASDMGTRIRAYAKAFSSISGILRAQNENTQN